MVITSAYATDGFLMGGYTRVKALDVKGHHARGQRNSCRGAAQRIVGFWLNPPWLCLIRESEGSRASPRSAEALGRKESARHQRCREAHRR